MSASITEQDVRRTVVDALAALGADPSRAAPDATFEELGIDSLDLVELAQIVEDTYGIVVKGDDVARIKRVGDAVDLVVGRAG